MSPEDGTARDAKFDLQKTVDRLERKDSITADDLESFRNALPTDPRSARAVQIALPEPWSELVEYVEGSENQAAYWRTTPGRRQIRSEADREHRERFAEAAQDTHGVEGTLERDGKEIPASAAQIAEELDGTSTAEEGTNWGDRAMNRLREILNE